MNWESPVTVFFCNIEDTLPDSFVLSILQQFGKVLSWKRAKNEKDRTLDFGFADFSSPKGAIKALKLAPHVTVLGKTWIARVDRKKEAEIDNYNSSRALDPSYKAIVQQEISEYQKTLTNIKNQIDSASFAKATQKISGIISSKYDEDRETEHFRYISDIKKENDEYERLFKEKLLQQKSLEAQKENEEHERAAKEKQMLEKRNARQMFLREWQDPELNEDDENSLFEFSNKWKEFNAFRKERAELRKQEIEQENLIE